VASAVKVLGVNRSNRSAEAEALQERRIPTP
jgi:hypothetical protein